MKACFIPERPACCNALLSTARRSRRAVYGRYQNRVNPVCATGAGGFQPAALCSASEARTAGARLKPSCAVLGITARTWQRWTQGGAVRADGRPTALRPAPSHALTEDERQAVLETTPRQARRPLCSPIQPALSAVAGPRSALPAAGRRRVRSSRAWPIRESTCLPAAGRVVGLPKAGPQPPRQSSQYSLDIKPL